MRMDELTKTVPRLMSSEAFLQRPGQPMVVSRSSGKEAIPFVVQRVDCSGFPSLRGQTEILQAIGRKLDGDQSHGLASSGARFKTRKGQFLQNRPGRVLGSQGKGTGSQKIEGGFVGEPKRSANVAQGNFAAVGLHWQGGRGR